MRNGKRFYVSAFQIDSLSIGKVSLTYFLGPFACRYPGILPLPPYTPEQRSIVPESIPREDRFSLRIVRRSIDNGGNELPRRIIGLLGGEENRLYPLGAAPDRFAEEDFGSRQEAAADMTCFYRPTRGKIASEPSTSRRMRRSSRADRKGIPLLYSGG